MVPENEGLIEKVARKAARHPMVTASSCLAGFVAAILVLMPTSMAEKDKELRSDLASGEVVKVAEAPDGATVYAVKREGHTIYFSKGAVAIPDEAQDSVKPAITG
jgi:hypothetical protein